MWPHTVNIRTVATRLGGRREKQSSLFLAQIAFTRKKTVQIDCSFSKRGAALPQKA